MRQEMTPRIATAELVQNWAAMAPAAFARAVQELSYRERQILLLRDGIDDGFCYTRVAVSRIFQITRERCRQIETKARRRLPQAMVRALAERLRNPDAD